ncbi:hypothetical protein CJF30_00007597 [Rutstroemia sp. NJR-2017a BBW]|nr:hypothetical protein CJF30_00007597 [Rutstroemia sp. NJR-2017a BBW]
MIAANDPDAGESMPGAYGNSIDLQLAILRYLPTPVVTLDERRKIIWTNRKADALFGGRGPLQCCNNGVIGKALQELGVEPISNDSWDSVFDKEESTRFGASTSRHEGLESTPGGVEVVLNNPKLNDSEKHYRIGIEVLSADYGYLFILSFEQMLYTERPTSNLESISPATPQTNSKMRTEPRNIRALKEGVFDSTNTPGFILTADEQFYLGNRKVREIIGDMMGGADGCEGAVFREGLEIWDENYVRRLEPDEYPGTRVVRTREPVKNFRCGITHSSTGERLTMVITCECLYDGDTGEFLGALCWCEQLQEYEEYLLQEQERGLKSHETICNLMPHLVWTTTVDGGADWYSTRWYQFTGLTEEESLGFGFTKAVHPDDLPILLEKWDKGRELAQDCEVEIRYRRNDGTYRWMHTRACPLKDENGKILKWYGTNTDINDVVMQRIEAKRNKDQMLTVLGHAEVNLFSTSDRKIAMAESGMLWQAQTIKGQIPDPQSLVGKDIIEICRESCPEGMPALEKGILDILAGKIEMEKAEDKVGDRIYKTRLVADLEHDSDDPGQVPKVVGVLGLSIDITDMKARAALELDNTRLMIEEQAAKESSQMKSQFLANMSHEMRTPTAGVIGMVDLLSEDTTLTAEQREYVSSIQLSAKALLTIVNDILDFSKIESGRLDIEEVPFNLSSTVNELCKLLRVFASQKNLDLVYKNEIDDGLEVLGDPGRIRQVLSNLLTNALKFTERGSIKITVKGKKLEPLESGEERIETHFIVEDTGIGIEKKVLDKLFRPFRQGDPSTARLYGGTGLGLTISRNLANLMSGSINLESEHGVGSRALFTVPLKISSYCSFPSQSDDSSSGSRFQFCSSNYNTHHHTPIASRPATPIAPADQHLINQQISNSDTNHVSPPYLRKGKEPVDRYGGGLSYDERKKVHVLVVEDNAINQTIALKTVRKLGFPATAVWNGREALSYLLNPDPKRPRPDIILMDVQMPVMDGYEATRILRTGIEYSNALSANEYEDAESSLTMRTLLRRRKGMLRDIPVIAMTASAIQGDQEKCIRAGMDGYLSKPVDKDRLEDMLIEWAGRKREVRELEVGKEEGNERDGDEGGRGRDSGVGLVSE